MCEPVTIAAITIGLTAAAGGASAYGSYQQSQAQEDQAEYAAQVAANNAASAEGLAKDATARGAEEERLHRLQLQKFSGDQRAGFAAKGLELDTFGTADALADTAALGEADAYAIRRDAAREAFGFRSQGMNFQAQSQLNQMRAKNTRKTRPWLVGADLLGTGANVFGGVSGGFSNGTFGSGA